MWHARGRVAYAEERIAPTGSAVGLVVFGDPIEQVPQDGRGEACRRPDLLCGPHTGPVVNRPLGETHVLGIVARPGACEAVFGAKAWAVRGRIVDLRDHWRGVELVRAGAAESPGKASAAIDAALAALATTVNADATPRFDRIDRVVAALEGDPMRSVASIAAEVDVTHAHLDHEFRHLVGMTPVALRRLLRLRAVLGSIDVFDEISWAEVAAEYGWADQAHLSRDFRRHTGVTPTGYVRAQRAAFSPDRAAAAVGFAPT